MEHSQTGRKSVTRSATAESRSFSVHNPEVLSTVIHRFGHEAGNPLTAIISVASVLDRLLPDAGGLKPGTPTRQFPYAASIAQEAWRVSGLVERLVWLCSAPLAEEYQVDPIDIIDSVSEQISRKQKLTPGDWDFSFPPDIPMILFSQEQFQFVISEAFLNALAYRNGFGKADAAGNRETSATEISISVTHDESSVEIVFSNPIAGPLAVDLSTLFDPFVTFSRGGSPSSKRSGIGLTALAACVDRFGGKTRVEECVDGDRWIFNLVLTLSSARPIPGLGGKRKKLGVETMRLSPDAKKLLIIENEELVATSLARLLEADSKVKIQATLVGDGTAALALLEADHSFDAVLCDLNLPGKSGRAIFSELRGRYPELASRLIFMTGGSCSPEIEKYLVSTGQPHLIKPFEVQKLLEALERVWSLPT